jgi:malonyl-CoA O-methyltransferase
VTPTTSLAWNSHPLKTPRHERVRNIDNAPAQSLVATNQVRSTHDLYERWAPSYPPMPHNPLMQAEQKAMLAQWPDVTGRYALDLACGTGRYSRLLAEGKAAEVIALDFSGAMLCQVSVGRRVRASMMQLPFVDGAFDVVISGLAVGHAPAIGPWMREIARVLHSGGFLLYSDFHPAAARAGLTRSFTDQHDRTHTLTHCDYDLASQLEAASAAHLSPDVVQELRVGIEFQETFPDSDAFYRRYHGLPLLLIVRARRH